MDASHKKAWQKNNVESLALCYGKRSQKGASTAGVPVKAGKGGSRYEK